MKREVHHLLSRIRRRIRLFILADTTLVAALLLGSLFWVALLADWLWEPTRTVRMWAWVSVAAALALVCYQLAWKRLRRPLPDGSVALLVERAHPELRDQLLTSVAPVQAADSKAFLKFVGERAAELAQEYHPAEIVSLRSLRPKSLVALAIAASILGFAVWQRAAFATWVDRMALADTRWPRSVHLTVDGFERHPDGRLVKRIPRFDSAELVVHADLTSEFNAPDEVEIRYQAPDGTVERVLCSRIGEAQKGRDVAQAYRHQFTDLREPLVLEVRGGDDRITNLHIEVLPRPRIMSLEIDVEFPAYLGMTPRRLTATSVVTVPIGTTLTLHGVASQPLRRVEATASIDSLAPLRTEIEESDPKAFRLTIANLTATGELSLMPVDVAEVSAREPYLLTLVAEADELPTATAQLVGIGSAVTPEARIPLSIRAEDDHAVDRLWVDLLVDGQPSLAIPSAPIAAEPAANAEMLIDLPAISTGDNTPSALAPGQRLSLVARAEDACDLSADPRIGSSRIITLDVVTGDQLLENLEREEINLRRTFERVIEKTIQTREKLQKTPLSDGPNLADEPRQAARIQLARVVDDMHQVTDETLSVAGAFQLIHDQLVNNRVGEEELKSRLRDRIAAPLRTIAESELRQLVASIDDFGQLPQPTPGDLDAVSSKTQAVIVQMQLVLEEMKALETYSEVVAMLRKLIQEQETLTKKTREDQRDQLRTLLED